MTKNRTMMLHDLCFSVQNGCLFWLYDYTCLLALFTRRMISDEGFLTTMYIMIDVAKARPYLMDEVRMRGALDWEFWEGKEGVNTM